MLETNLLLSSTEDERVPAESGEQTAYANTEATVQRDEDPGEGTSAQSQQETTAAVKGILPFESQPRDEFDWKLWESEQQTTPQPAQENRETVPEGEAAAGAGEIIQLNFGELDKFLEEVLEGDEFKLWCHETLEPEQG